jgi:hypothetical protein
MHEHFSHILKISCLKDTITDHDFWDVPTEVRVLSEKFIEIKYAVRGGSGVGLGNTLILCVKNNRLYEAMRVLGYSNGESGDQQEYYSIKVSALKGDNLKKYELVINIHDRMNSKSDPETNYNYTNQSILHFDVSRNVFYSIKEDLFDSFINVYDSKADKTHKQPVKGNFPVIILGKEKYYFIKGEWYDLRRDNIILYKYAPNITK